MPDANGRIKGTGWSRAGEAAWERAFGSNAASQQPTEVDEWAEPTQPCCGDIGREDVYYQACPDCPYAVPHEPSDEVDEWLADRSEAEEDWEADNQAARDGYNPAR